MGGLRYGDTSLIRAAGRFGIGGISPYDNPIAVKRKILSKLRTMPMNEAIFAAQQLGITDAELRMAKDTGSSVGGINQRTRELGGSAMTRDIATQYALTNVGSTRLNDIFGGAPAAALESFGSVAGGLIGTVALYKGAKGAMKGGKFLSKFAGKSVAKKIPIIGALAGLGFAADRAMRGDWLGASGEVGSGLASIVPMYGTAASVGIDAWLAKRDSDSESSGNKSQESTPYIGEYVGKTLNISTINVDNIVVRGSMGVIENAL